MKLPHAGSIRALRTDRLDNTTGLPDAFKRSLDIDTKKVETYVNLGVSYANMGKYQEAIDMLNQALGIDPNRAETLSKTGYGLQPNGKI